MSETENKIDSPEILITIVDRNNGDKIVKLFESLNICANIILLGTGTANSDILDFLGIGETAKDVVLTLINESKVTQAFDLLYDKMQLEKPGKGIAFTVPMASIVGLKKLKELGEQ
jgi:hypothetical protein